MSEPAPAGRRTAGGILTVLSMLVLAAHWWRQGALLLVLPTLAMPFLLLIRASWATRLVQAALVLATLEWLRTAAVLGRARTLAGEPWLRMALILGTVALVSGLAAYAVRERRVPPA